MKHKTYFVFAILSIVSFSLGSCASPKAELIVSPTTLPATVTSAVSPTHSPVPIFTETPSPKPETPSPKPSEASATTLPIPTTMFLGTAIPNDSESTSSANIQRLTYMAQWGRGTVLGTAFTPDGSTFVVGSPFGLAIYNVQELQSVPVWVPFDKPTDYEALSFSQDGKYLRLTKVKNRMKSLISRPVTLLSTLRA